MRNPKADLEGIQSGPPSSFATGWPMEIVMEYLQRAIDAEAQVTALENHIEWLIRTSQEMQSSHATLTEENDKMFKALKTLWGEEDCCWFDGKTVDMPCVKNRRLSCKVCVKNEFSEKEG